MMQPYQQTDAYKRSQRLDPITGAPVFPLRLIEQRQSAERVQRDGRVGS